LLFLTCSLAVGILGCGHSTSRSPSDSGVIGRVLISPTCPGPVGGDRCGPKSYPTIVEARQHGGATTRVRTDANGRFRVELPSGRYILKPQSNGPLPFARRVRVRVKERSYTHVRLVLDSGLR
jgi:hypothetical protein